MLLQLGTGDITMKSPSANVKAIVARFALDVIANADTAHMDEHTRGQWKEVPKKSCDQHYSQHFRRLR